MSAVEEEIKTKEEEEEEEDEFDEGGDVLGSLRMSLRRPSMAQQKSVYRRFSVDVSTDAHFTINTAELLSLWEDSDEEDEDDEEEAKNDAPAEEKEFKVSSPEKFCVGAYQHIRATKIDYTYHSHYRQERQWLHDSIVEDYIANDSCTLDDWDHDGSVAMMPEAQGTQWFILSVGVQGAGKHHSIEFLRDHKHLPLASYCFIDTDEIRRLLPEYYAYLASVEPAKVNELTRKEAGYIAETLCWAALETGKSIIWDTSLESDTWFQGFIAKVAENYPGIKVGMIHVSTDDVECIHDRCEKKIEETGREIDTKAIQSILDRLPKSINIVQRGSVTMDYVCTIRNNVGQPLAIRRGAASTLCAEKGFEEDNWGELSGHFAQVCPYVPGRSKRYSKKKVLEAARPRRAPQRGLQRGLSRKASVRGGLSRSVRFSTLTSSETNHSADNLQFYGRFAHIRATLDYSYHKNYTFERQRFQDSLIQSFLESALVTDKDGTVCTTPTEPWIVFTAGAMGAGKSYTMKKLVEHGRFPLLAFVNVDPDEIRRRLPEYDLYVSFSPELAGELTRKEAGFIAEILTLAGLETGKNVLVDGSLRDSDWYQLYFARLRREFPHLRQSILHVTAPLDAVIKRAESRGQATGRVIPKDLLLAAYEQVPRSVHILGPLVDYVAELNNPEGVPDIELVTPGQTWETFSAQWVQMCAWKPRHLRRKASS